MQTSCLPPIDQIVSIGFKQANFGRLAILTTSNVIQIIVSEFSSSSQSLNLTCAYNITLPCNITNNTNNMSNSQMQLQTSSQLLIAYCYNQSFLWEYLINNTNYILRRSIPLYIFQTSAFAGMDSTLNYYLVPVTLMSWLPPYIVNSNYRLAMMFGMPTSSSIQ
jgi:hypothetical protein